MPSLRLITDATAEPVTVEDFKLHIRMNSTETDEDAVLQSLIKSARKLAENRMRRNCCPQTWELKLDTFKNEIILPRAPLSSASTDVAITFLDSSGDSTTLSSTVYRVDTDSEPGRITLDYGQTWPTHYAVPRAVTIQFKAGYPTNTASTPATDTCPEEIETWIKMRAAALYEQRESHDEQRFVKMPHSFVDGLLDPYVLIEVDP
jgi:uncharacterized phiE125 gp8 family phage protein